METELKIINELEDQTKLRLGVRFTQLTDLRIDLTRVERKVAPEWYIVALHYNGSMEEAIDLTNHELFNTWQQIQGVGDELLKNVAEQERG